MIGKFDLNQVDEVGTVNASVRDIRIHPDWNPESENFDADIAIVVLNLPVSRTFKGARLPPYSWNEISGSGTVVRFWNNLTCISFYDYWTFKVAWGKSIEGESFDPQPNKLFVPIVNGTHCFLNAHDLVKIASPRTFCGGYLNKGKAPCIGDGGAGLFVKHSPSSSLWTVQGIVSASTWNAKYGCDINSYSIYTNVAQFSDWIKRTLQETASTTRRPRNN